MRKCLLPCCAVLLLSCSSVPVVDNSPRQPALVVVEQVELSGAKGYFPYRGRQITWTRPEQRRIQQDVAFTASALGALGQGAERAYLFDLTRPSLIQVDYDTRQHHRCDLLGCYEYSEMTRSVPAQPPLLGADGCRLRVEDARLSLKPNQQTRELAGRAAQGYDLEWRIAISDPRGRIGVSRLYGALWLAPEQTQVAELGFDAAFQAGYSRALGVDWRQLPDYVPWVPLNLMQRYFLKTLSAEQRARALAFNAFQATDSLRVIAGELRWSIAGQACGWQTPDTRRSPPGTAAGAPDDNDAALPEEGGDGIETFDDFINAVVAELDGNDQPVETLDEKAITPIKDNPEPQGKQIFEYKWTLQSRRVDEVTDNQLRVPPDFKQGTRF